MSGMGTRARRRAAAAVAGLALAGALAGCGSDSSVTTLNWYVNPDGVDTFEKYAAQCSTDRYRLEIQQLPTGATDQRTQLARRLAAQDSATDLMNLDPVFVAEFANAGWLREVPAARATQIADSGNYLQGAVAPVLWEDKVYAIPLWANTQVLWYRKSLAEAAGLDLSGPVTWDQVIDAAASQQATVGVQANRYEAYVVWINAMIQGAGGQIVGNTDAGRKASVEIDSDAGARAAGIIKKLVDSGAAQPDLTTSNEGTSLGLMFGEDSPGEFMVNWTFVYKNYEGLVGKPGGPADESQFDDLGWARYPASVSGQPSKPPIGGIDIGVGAFTKNATFAEEAAECITSTQAQVDLAMNNGLMPATNSAYDEVSASGDFPADLIELYRTSVDEGGARPSSAFYSQISSAVQSVWHSPTEVSPESTPKESATFLSDVLSGKRLL